MIQFVESPTQIKAYFINPLTEERRLIGSCELFVSEEAIAHWKQCINSSSYAQVSELLELVAKFSPQGSVVN